MRFRLKSTQALKEAQAPFAEEIPGELRAQESTLGFTPSKGRKEPRRRPETLPALGPRGEATAPWWAKKKEQNEPGRTL